MKKLFIVSLVIPFTLIFVACGNKPTAKIKQQATTVVPEPVELTTIKEHYAMLETAPGGTLAAAQGSLACAAAKRLDQYEELGRDYNQRGFKDEFRETLIYRTREIGRETASLGYEKMKAGKSFKCSGGRETHYIELFTKIMDKYGPSKEGETFDSSVVREAYLNAAKKEIGDLVARYEKDPDNSDLIGGLSGAIEEATRNWHFTARELEVPDDVVKRLGLEV